MRPGALRLLHLREQTEAVGATMAEERGRFDRLADPASAPRIVSAFNLFQTPEPLAERMAAELGRRALILEPSAGLGRLYRAARDDGHNGRVVLVELAPDCCRELYGMIREDDSAELLQGDFLAQTVGNLRGPFDGILMNPPFKQGRDIRHIRHAYGMLAPGGRLVALCANGPRQRAQIKPIAEGSGGWWEELPPGTFLEAGTNVNAALLTIET